MSKELNTSVEPNDIPLPGNVIEGGDEILTITPGDFQKMLVSDEVTLPDPDQQAIVDKYARDRKEAENRRSISIEPDVDDNELEPDILYSKGDRPEPAYDHGDGQVRDEIIRP